MSQYGSLHALISLLCPKQMENSVCPQQGNQLGHNRQGALARGTISRHTGNPHKDTHIRQTALM